MPLARFEDDQVTVLVTHHATTGPSDALEDYLRSRRFRVVVIEHGFGEATRLGTTVRVWERGELIKERRIPWSRHVPGPITWINDSALSLSSPIWARGRVTTYVGIDSLNAFAGLVLRVLGLARHVVFWTIDYAPSRFESRLLNRVYFALDRICVTRCNETWNLSPRMAEGRRERGTYGRQTVVPMGANVRTPIPAKFPHRIVHMGSLLPKQGVQIAIEALPLVKIAIPDARLLVVGGGPFRASLEELAHRAGVADAVEFVGYVDDHTDVERFIAESAVAVATYDPSQAGFTYYADPGKIKTYLAAGVPVVMTDVPWSARWATDRGAGVLVDYTAQDVASGLLTLLRDLSFRAAAAKLGQTCDWRVIFDEAFPPSGASTDECERVGRILR